MVSSRTLAVALLDAADSAELVPYTPSRSESGEDLQDDAEAAERTLPNSDGPDREYGAMSFGISDDVVAGQPLPSAKQTWITITPFEHLTEEEFGDSKLEKDGPLATILRKRMGFLVLFAHLSFTRKCDWQMSFPTNFEEPSPPVTGASDRFDWSRVLRRLTVAPQDDISFESALAALRWGRPRFLIECGYEDLPGQFPAMLESFLMGSVADATSRKLDEMPLNALLSEEIDSVPSRHCVVELGLSLQAARVSTSLLDKILDVLERFAQASRHMRRSDSVDKRIRVEFRVTSFLVGSRCLVSGGALEMLSQRVRDSTDLHFKEIKLMRLVQSDCRDLQQWLTNAALPMQVAAPNGAANGEATRGLSGLNTLAISQTLDEFSRLGSLVRCGSSLQELNVCYNVDDLDALAAWLAFGFFHVDSASRVQTLRLRMPGSVEIVVPATSLTLCSPGFTDIFRRVLTQVVSSEDLAPLHPKTTASSAKRKRDDPEYESPLDEEPLPHDKRVFVEVAAKTKARAQPSVRSAVVATLSDGSGESEATEQFQVIRRLREWLAVVVAGAGAGWIPRKAVVKESTLPTRLIEGQLTNGRVTSFTWEGGSSPVDDELKRQHCTVLVDLLESIGSQLDVLQFPFQALQKHHLAPIVEHCPNLTALNLFGNCIDDIAPLVEAYELGRCKISSLSIAEKRNEQALIVQQCTKILELCRGSGAIKRPSIKQLSVQFSAPDGLNSTEVATVLVPIFKAVRSHEQLEHTQLITDCPDMRDLWHAIGASEVGQRATRPFAFPCKLAMLSAVHHDALRQSRLSAMDARVLSLVFRLAGSVQSRVDEIVLE